MPRGSKPLPSTRIRRWVYEALTDAKGQDIAVLDMRRICDFTDYMMIASGNSVRHVQSMADKVRDKLREHEVLPMGTEGHEVGEWVLLDYGAVVVHVMRPQTRVFYGLEKLWSDAKRIKLRSYKPPVTAEQ